MSDDSPLPPNGADPDDDVNDVDVDALDPEEAAAASALAQALEGRSAARVPDAALETAALLRYSGTTTELSEQRRAALREQVLASLPAASSRSGATQTGAARSALWRWLGIGMPLAGAAAAVWLVVGAFQQAGKPELARRADERAASATAAGEGAAAPSYDENTAAENRASENIAAENLASEKGTARYQGASDRAAGDRADEAARGEPLRDRLANPRTSSAMKVPQAASSETQANAAKKASSGALARGRAASNEDGAPMAEPPAGALAARSAPAPSAPAAAGPASRAEASRAEDSRAGGSDSLGSGAGLGAAEAKRGAAPGAPSNERLQRSSQRFRARLLPRLGDTRVNQTYAELDRAQSSAELRQAQTNLTALASGPLGSNGNSSGDTTDADLLRQDIYCRLAEVALRLGQPKVALDWARRGLELPAPPNPFTARLWHVQGQARAALGDQDGAAKSYMKAIEVNERLLDESLDGSE